MRAAVTPPVDSESILAFPEMVYEPSAIASFAEGQL
jgi:hypothetical protein